MSEESGSSARWRRLWEVFDAAVELPPASRERYLRETCRDDTSLGDEVHQLLLGHDATSSLLERPPVASVQIPADPASLVGQRIGVYRLTGVLGVGGMGVVYAAEQEEPVRRGVAIKLVKLGMDTHEVIQRFEIERQALARMDHSRIARVLDAGSTGEGRPYFVMERVDGEPITAYCDQRGLDIGARLRLFVELCGAVHHAHQKGLVHRDLKPSNVLVVEEDGRPLPKIIDFGIAKALERDDAGETLVTVAGGVLGTAEYMSPEQAGGQTGIDIRTDIYSLGVLLYELLTGCLPFEREGGSAADVQLRVLEETPARPSARVGEEGFQWADRVARARATDPRGLRRALLGDLDWIVLRALEKEPDRRYASVSELAADVGRALANEPVLAGPPTAGYRIGKFVRRHRWPVVGAVAGVGMLVGFATLTARQSRQVRRALARAELERARSGEVSEFLVDLFEVADPWLSRGETITAREILDRGVERIRRDLQGQPAVRASLLYTMGRVYQNLGLFQAARELLEEAIALRRALAGDPIELRKAMRSLAHLHHLAGDEARAEEILLELDSAHPAAAPGAPEAEVERAETLFLLGALRHRTGDLDEAEDRFAEALAIQERPLGARHEKSARTRTQLASVLRSKRAFDRAEPLVRSALEIQRELHGARHPAVATSLAVLATVLHRSGRHREAEPVYRETVELKRAVYGPRHRDVAQSLSHLGALLVDMDRAGEAAPLYREAIAIQREALGERHSELAIALNNYGLVLRAERRHDEAIAAFEEALSINREVWGEEHWTIGGNLFNLALVHQDRGEVRRAETLYRESLERQRRSVGPRHPGTAYALHGLGKLLLEEGRFAESEPFLREALTIREAALAADDPALASTREALEQLAEGRDTRGGRTAPAPSAAHAGRVD